jgi:hypothetical protein
VLKKVGVGDPVHAHIKLAQVGPDEKVDVTAVYTVTDKSGKIYAQTSETFFVDGNKDYIREIPTNGLPAGEYVLSITVLYPGSFATSTQRFLVENNEIIPFRRITLLISFISLLFIIAILAYRVYKFY